MCIRDRLVILLAEVAPKVAARARPEPLALALAPMTRFLAAVSYTHLRAHETVLDLVCRLLLEKKTQSRIITPITTLVGTTDTRTKLYNPHPQA